jgi:hypothetical protein
MMYSQDYDETIIPWYVRTGLPRNGDYRDDLRSWVFNLQPYIKNGEPVKPPITPFNNVKPIGLMACPSFNDTKFREAANRPDCDGANALDSWIPAKWYHANYGIGFGVVAGSCTNEDPYFHFAGSSVGPADGSAISIMSQAQVQRVAETVEVTDGFTGVIQSGGFGTTMGCESAESHTGGGTHIFVDGHAKWIARNSERYLATDPSGCVYKRYYTVDR